MRRSAEAEAETEYRRLAAGKDALRRTSRIARTNSRTVKNRFKNVKNDQRRLSDKQLLWVMDESWRVESYM